MSTDVPGAGVDSGVANDDPHTPIFDRNGMLWFTVQGGNFIGRLDPKSGAVALKEASERSFGTYARQIVKNARALSLELQRCGLRIVSGGTDTHLLLVDTWKNGVGGEAASTNLESIGIVTNKNAIPFDSRKPADPSGIRLGTPSVTTRGMKENEMIQLARLIAAGIEKRGRSETMRLRKAVERLARAFPAFAKKKAR